jgi:membrane dipeptidase
MVSLFLRIERESQGRVRVCRHVNDIHRCLENGVLAPVLHIEGAEAIDPNFEFLEVLYEAGLRSLGPVWSRCVCRKLPAQESHRGAVASRMSLG